jgi:predicted Zn-dependent protease with MMP-like domain
MPCVSSRIETLLDEGWEALEAGDEARAESLGRQVLDQNPASVEARLLIGRVLSGREDHAGASAVLREAVAFEPGDLDARVELGIALFNACEFRQAEAELKTALDRSCHNPEAHYWMALCLERRGDRAGAEKRFRQAQEMAPEEFGLPTRISRRECETAVEEAIAQLPARFRSVLRNLSVQIEDVPDEELLHQQDPPLDPLMLGFFEGEGVSGGSTFDVPELPSRILIFQRNLERFCRDREELVTELVVTLRHEVGHYLGLEEDELADSGYE